MFCRSCRLLRLPTSRSFTTSTIKFNTLDALQPSIPTKQATTTPLVVKPRRKDLIAREPELAMTSRKLPTSLKKMDKLASQINHKPLSHAILQMRFSNKRHAPHLEKLLQNAMRGAIAKGMDADSLVIDQAWITKGKFVARKWIKGRGRMAVQRRPRVGIDVRVRDKTTLDRRAAEKRAKMVKKLMKGTGLIDRPIYNSAVFTC